MNPASGFGAINRVGGEDTLHVAVRVISATNQVLEALVARKKFREDLFYRLSVVPIRLPPMRERVEDVRPPAEYSRNNFKPKRIETEDFETLRGHRWPGNVRELRNVVERMSILSVSDLITVDSIPSEIRLPRDTAMPPSLEETRAQAECDLIRQALDEAGGNVSAAARALGVERPRLHKRIRSLGLAKENQR